MYGCLFGYTVPNRSMTGSGTGSGSGGDEASGTGGEVGTGAVVGAGDENVSETEEKHKSLTAASKKSKEMSSQVEMFCRSPHASRRRKQAFLHQNCVSTSLKRAPCRGLHVHADTTTMPKKRVGLHLR